jgi:hypothetical protein
VIPPQDFFLRPCTPLFKNKLFKYQKAEYIIMLPWQKEWNKFSPESIEKMKTFSDMTHEEKEWMSYVYDIQGVYQLGEPSYGGESRIEVNPSSKGKQDNQKNGYKESQRKWTIHGHPLKDGKIYTGRQYFSSTDICREFVKSRDNDEYIVQFLVYPHKQLDSNTNSEVFHNRVRILVFPNKQTVMQAMQISNPGVNAGAITVESGQNRQVATGDGGVGLENDSGVNWFVFQEALGKLGYMGIVDIEGPQGGKQFKSEGYIRTGNLFGIATLGIIFWQMFKFNKSNKLDIIKKSSEEMQNLELLSKFG